MACLLNQCETHLTMHEAEEEEFYQLFVQMSIKRETMKSFVQNLKIVKPCRIFLKNLSFNYVKETMMTILQVNICFLILLIKYIIYENKPHLPLIF